VLPALLRKAHEAKLAGASSFGIWGSGTPRREFLHVDDLADACVFLMRSYSSDEHVNVGFGDDIAIRDLAELVANTVGFAGTVETDPSKPDGTPRKLMDSGKLRAMGWTPQIALQDGVAATYRWALENRAFA
jgi:GDP-L-fucose synthase